LVQTDDIIRTYNSTNATSTSTGALQIVGGAGIGGDLWVGGTVYVLNATIGTAVNISGGSTGTVLFQDASSSTKFTNVGDDNDILVSRGVNTLGPRFVNTNTFIVGYANTALNVASATAALTANTATNLAGGTVNQIPYQTSTGVTSFFGPGTAGQLLISNGTIVGGPLFVNTNTFIVGYANTALNVANAGTAISASTATNLAGGTAGQVPYQVAPGQTDFYGPGTAGNVLVSNGTSAPSYNNTLTLASTLASTTTVASNALYVAGGIGIGQTLYVTGDVYSAGEITAYYSDDRLKNRLEDIPNALDKVKSLSGFYYTPNETALSFGYKDKRQVGVSAQATQKILPEIVTTAPVNADYLTVQYEKFIPLLIEAIKELSAEVDELKKKIQ
jgi:hypothetical protein